MKKHTIFNFLIFVILISNFAQAQYEIQSPYLKNPETIKPFITKSADFWKKSVDWNDGGFYTEVNQDGSPQLTSRKSFVQCSRHAYGFTRAFMVSGNKEYLDYANHAIQFLYDHAWDDQNGGWFFSSNKKGDLASPYGGSWNPNYEKWSFQQHYNMLGIGALAEASRDSLHLSWFDRSVAFNDNNLWDNRDGYEGFFDTANSNWSDKWGKGFTPTVDGITTWVLSRALLTNEQEDIDRLIVLADNIMDHFYQNMFLPQVKLGFPESYTSNWDLDPNSTGASTGHVIKTAWCLARAYMFTNNNEYLEAAQYMINDIMENGGYDYDNGGLYGDFNWNTGGVVKNKNHWMLEQGLTGGLINYFIATDSIDRALNLNMADGCLSFYMDHFIDAVNGECFLETNAQGAVINNDKSDPFKGGYHNIEMSYLTYVYGNLFLHHKPVSLYYHFDKNDEKRMFKMSPIAIQDDILEISSVELDGEIYLDFNESTREITLPADVGGVFKITYVLDESFVAVKSLEEHSKIDLFPNPADDYIYIEGDYNGEQIEFFSLGGKIVLSIDNSINDDKVDVSSMSPGIYFIRIQSEGKIWNQKIIIQRE